MRARYEVTYNRNDTVDLKLSGVTILGYEQSDPERSDDHVSLGMSADAFEFLTGDKVRTHLKSSLDDALNQVQRLSDERDLWKSLAERQDNTAPLRMELSTVKRDRDFWRSRFEGAQANAEYVREQYGHPDEVDELKAVIVSQAREIARLKGESE
ncbi:hypothetical protein [Streptomyces sp. MH60]|uniref:hypothetical protein n=1 Tax=Streptomyces sp. MH60 TaxID=1940758 RepID=UPI000CEE8044|nr:hypothetical protein [Streptomyces sp. MH60]PPS86428.1 hypothetical protein BZZ08_03395 [Streptomyces sp. MH60]